MRTVVIPSGLVILGLSALAGWRLGGGAQSMVIATKIFIPILARRGRDQSSWRYIMSNGKAYKGSCFCGEVQFTVSGDPVGMGYCHCESCRRWSAGPVNAFTLWKPETVQITRGSENIGTYNKTQNSFRKWCKTCGGHIFTEHPGMGLTDVYAAVIPDFPYHAGVHVHYQETKLRMKDGLPKMKDVPKEMGGSGVSMAE